MVVPTLPIARGRSMADTAAASSRTSSSRTVADRGTPSFPDPGDHGGVPLRSRSSRTASGIRGWKRRRAPSEGECRGGRRPLERSRPLDRDGQPGPEARIARTRRRALARTRSSGSRSIRRTGTRSAPCVRPHRGEGPPRGRQGTACRPGGPGRADAASAAPPGPPSRG